MRRLLPSSEPELDTGAAVEAEERRRSDDAPWVMTNMVAAPDGTIALDGRSGPLGSPGDRSVFRALRRAADVVVVGAGTARTERYRLPTLTGGGAPDPTGPGLCVVSSSLELSFDLPFLDHGLEDPAAWPIVATTTTAPAHRRAELSERAVVVDAGVDRVEPRSLVEALAARGAGVILCEGGPNLLAQFAEEDLVDEWSLTIAPWMVGGDGADRLIPRPLRTPRRLHLERLFAEEDHLFARYLRADDRAGGGS